MNISSDIIKCIFLEENITYDNKVFSPASLLLLLSIVKDYEEDGSLKDEINSLLNSYNFRRDLFGCSCSLCQK